MSVIERKRITLKRTRPNPLFQEWLEELHEEAVQKRSKLEPMLKQALDSLLKYPLPLQSGAECGILKGFDKRLCLFLDKRLEVYESSTYKTVRKSLDRNTELTPEDENNLDNIGNILTNLNDNKHFSKNTEYLAVRKYTEQNKPLINSGSYAILMIFLDLKKNQSFNKDQLIEAIQKCHKNDISHIWSSVTELVAHGLIKQSKSSKPKFSLTEEGYCVARELKDTKSKKIVDVTDVDTVSIPNCKIASRKEYNDALMIKETEINLHNVNKVTENHILPSDGLVLDDNSFIEMEVGSFDIILLIDKCETSGLTKKNDPTVSQFNKYPDLKHEYRNLKVGDFTWIARHKDHHQELVLPYVVERKRMDDLASSVKDGRFHEQKFRLRKCGLSNVIYMVENHGSNKYTGLPIQTLMQALANTSVQDGFKVHITDSLSDSARFLAMMTLRLMYEYKNKCLKGHCKESKDDILMTFNYFNKSSVKNKALSVTDTFIKLLLQLKGVSVEKALAITNVYKTPRLLIEACQTCNQKEGEMLLANLKYGRLNRSVGPSVSKSVYQLFSLRTFD